VPSLKQEMPPLTKSSALSRCCACGQPRLLTWTERPCLCKVARVLHVLANALPSRLLATSNVQVLAYHEAKAVQQQPEEARTLAAALADSKGAVP